MRTSAAALPVRADLAAATESAGVPATRYGVSTETVPTRRPHGPEDCADDASRRTSLPGEATDAERPIVRPPLTRDRVDHVAKAERLHRLADVWTRQQDFRARRRTAAPAVASAPATVLNP
ncbi:MAG TPA: hypothetical protein VGD56_10080 [Gemmatirosa sp.]